VCLDGERVKGNGTTFGKSMATLELEVREVQTHLGFMRGASFLNKKAMLLDTKK
jgi:hypothetical protein